MTSVELFLPGNMRSKVAEWLGQKFQFTHAITLTSHDPMLNSSAMRARLKRWDARVNRKLYGPKWTQHRDELLWYFAFLEKPNSNPHWHLLARVVGRQGIDSATCGAKLPSVAERAWKTVTPSGTAKVQKIFTTSYKTIGDYVAKELIGKIQYEEFLTPDEFRRY